MSEKRKFASGTEVEIKLPYGREPITGVVIDPQIGDNSDDYITIRLGDDDSYLNVVNVFWWDVRAAGEQEWLTEPLPETNAEIDQMVEDGYLGKKAKVSIDDSIAGQLTEEEKKNLEDLEKSLPRGQGINLTVVRVEDDDPEGPAAEMDAHAKPSESDEASETST